jgi:hypothetical protein
VQPCWVGICIARLHLNEASPQDEQLLSHFRREFLKFAGFIRRDVKPAEVTRPSEIIDWPIPEPETTKVTLRFGSQSVTKEFRRGFGWERITDWAEKTWEISGVMHCVKLNGED